MTPRREPMSAVDTAWLRMESPTNLMMIGVVLVLEDPVDINRLKNLLQERFLKFERFRQRVVFEDGRPYWQDDPRFHLDNHIHRLGLSGPMDEHELKRIAAALFSTPLNFAYPLWQVHVVERYEGGSALIARIHHCIADGLALVRVLLSLTDSASMASQNCTGNQIHTLDREQMLSGQTPAQSLWSAQSVRQFLHERLHQGQEWLNEGWNLLRDPRRLLNLARQGLAAGSELTRVGIMPPDPPTRLKGRLSGQKRVAWAEPLQLAEVKALGKEMGATINDVLLAAATSALRKYLARRGDDIAHEHIHVAVPFNLRPLDKPVTTLGNQFGLVILPLPIGLNDPLERFEQVRNNMRQLKESCQAQVFYGLLNALGRGPHVLEQAALEVLSRKASAVMTNVPGPSDALYLAGSRLRQPLFWVPQSGEVGVGLSIFSYAGTVQFGLIADKNLIPDPHVLMDDFAASYRELERLTQVRGSLPAPCRTAAFG